MFVDLQCILILSIVSEINLFCCCFLVIFVCLFVLARMTNCLGFSGPAGFGRRSRDMEVLVINLGRSGQTGTSWSPLLYK